MNSNTNTNVYANAYANSNANIKKYTPFFYKKENKKRIKKKHIPVPDTLSFIVFNKLNENDCYYKYNEKMEKIKILEKLEEIKIKNKMKLINNLNDSHLDLQTLNFICLILKINIIWYNDLCYIKMNYNNNSDSEQLYLYNSLNFTSQPELSDKYEIMDVNKPLKCISYYKLDELKEIYTQLKFNHTVKLKKEIYKVIHDYFVSLKLI